MSKSDILSSDSWSRFLVSSLVRGNYGKKVKLSLENNSRKTLCSSRKYPYPPQGRSLEIPRGRGVSKAKIFKGMYEAKLEIPGGWGGSNQKTFRGGDMDIFWNHTFAIRVDTSYLDFFLKKLTVHKFTTVPTILM